MHRNNLRLDLFEATKACAVAKSNHDRLQAEAKAGRATNEQVSAAWAAFCDADDSQQAAHENCAVYEY